MPRLEQRHTDLEGLAVALWGRRCGQEANLHSLAVYMLEWSCEQTEDQFGERTRIGFGKRASYSHQPTEAPAT